MKHRIILPLMMAIATPAAAQQDWQQNFFGHSSTYSEKHKHYRDRDHEHYVNNYRPRPTIRHIDRGPRSYMPTMHGSDVVELRRPREPTRVMSWEYRESAETMRNYPNCKRLVEVVGVEAHSEEIARQRAIAQWAATVRFADGERYMSILTARAKRFMCGPSTVPGVGMVSDFKEAGANLIGKTAEGIRCRLKAHPCSALEGEEVR